MIHFNVLVDCVLLITIGGYQVRDYDDQVLDAAGAFGRAFSLLKYDIFLDCVLTIDPHREIGHDRIKRFNATERRMLRSPIGKPKSKTIMINTDAGFYQKARGILVAITEVIPVISRLI